MLRPTCPVIALSLAAWACGVWAAQPVPGTTPGLTEPGIPPKSAAGALPARAASPAEIPDIYGPGAVLTVGNVYMKVTNFGVVGNPYTHLSSDPSGQWPGPSGVEYLRAIVLAVGGVNPTVTDPRAARRVSSGNEWRPATLDPVDRIYTAHEGIAEGLRLTNDDRDLDPSTGLQRADEEFLDGHDNDGDGRVDEDYAALGELMYSCVMRDDTPAAIATVTDEPHAPLGLECRMSAWAYSFSDYLDFNVIEYTVTNRSGHELDSLYFGFPTDLDAGSPSVAAGYYVDDRDLPFFPNGQFTITPKANDPRLQNLCSQWPIRIHGFSVVDNDGDQGRTPGVAMFLLFGHTHDPLGLNAPRRVGFSAFRSYPNGTPFTSGGGPTVDQQRFELMRSRENVDFHPIFLRPDAGTGFINAPGGVQPNDYAAWPAIGPFRRVPNGGSITATIGFAVAPGTYDDLRHYPEDYAQYRAGDLTLEDLLRKYPALEKALTAQVAYEGVYERPRPGFTHLVPNCAGCETGIKLPPGTPAMGLSEPPCSETDEPPTRLVVDYAYTWFDMDCDFCTGARGYYLRRWDAKWPPPRPNLNVSAAQNYSDNPDRVVAAGDGEITLAWDNLSEYTADPKTGWFDFRSYRIWKVADWKRPVGSAGPTDEDWALLAELRWFDHSDSNFLHDPVTDTLICPMTQVLNYEFPPGHERCAPENAARYPTRFLLHDGGCRDSATIGLCLRRGDLWDRQSGLVVRPDTTVDCVRRPSGECVQDTGFAIWTTKELVRTRYPVGRYRYVDRDVKNGFPYFYSITAGDSIDVGDERYGRRAALEADMVTPQAAARADQGVWVVPNPYRGYRSIGERPSAWDLTPNATDPTGTHVDFMGLPRGKWRIRIYTVAGDLVAELHSDDAVNAASRADVRDEHGNPRPGYNRQQDHPNDGQAQWNLISRNGQDVMSGIYVFVVDSPLGRQRGKFVIIR